MKAMLWAFAILVVAIHTQQVTPAAPPSTFPACKCNPCPCQGVVGVPVTFTDGTKGVRLPDGTYKVIAATPNASQSTPNVSPATNSSGSPNSSGCRVINGQLVCPTRKW